MVTDHQSHSISSISVIKVEVEWDAILKTFQTLLLFTVLTAPPFLFCAKILYCLPFIQ